MEQLCRCERCDEDDDQTSYIPYIVRQYFDMKDPQQAILANLLIDALKNAALEH